MTTALVLGITADLDFAAGAFLAGFRRHNPDFSGEVVILQDGLPPASQAALSRLMRKSSSVQVSTWAGERKPLTRPLAWPSMRSMNSTALWKP